MTQPPATSISDRLAVGYQLKIHLLGISPQISRRVLVRDDTTLAELHHIFQVVMGWENGHLHCFHLWGKDYGLSYAGGTWYADDARRVHLGDFAWRVNDKFTYTYKFGDYWQHQVRVEKLLLPPAVPTAPVCVSGRRACPPEEVGGPRGYDQRSLDQFSWQYEAQDRLLAGEDIFEDDVPTWFWTYRPEHFDKGLVNQRLAKVYQLKVTADFLLSQGSYAYFFADKRP
ncbi:plasmid pRiA4b ORF-3 family protein [Hymenobacter puniceus]|uniref:plasmid pRiA4b ORF-3 family protein n=1 Tax=Hymenobacter sp. BT190 TaxID=2763505 RepID=UPI0016514684|nr:plasmid pRiA4b ORF-3 family protein [Hymenobacter sp. BT190]MBC6700155.1 plasmid pRiA4b ORF-3 family protein [Hymenobacter sp. BT190]